MSDLLTQSLKLTIATLRRKFISFFYYPKLRTIIEGRNIDKLEYKEQNLALLV